MGLRYLTAGESHGRALVGILEGMPAGVPISKAYIDHQLRRRQGGYGRGGRQAIERDRVEVLAGLRFGATLGSPIALLIWNRDWENWKPLMDPFKAPSESDDQPVTVPRPGHADLAGALKYGFSDIRNVLERSSARETAMHVALGALARQLLEHFEIRIASHVLQIHDVRAEGDWAELKAGLDLDLDLDLDALTERADASPVRCLDPHAEKGMIARIERARREGDSVGGVFELIARGVPVGLGSYVHWDRRLESRLAAALMSIPAQKSVEFGRGREVAARWGTEAHDEIHHDPERGFYRTTNRAGGIEGGMSTGEDLVVRVVMKPLSTLMRPLDSVDLITKEPAKAHRERSDVCAVPAASVIGEAVLALVLADAFLEKFGGDSLEELEAHVKWAQKRRR